MCFFGLKESRYKSGRFPPAPAHCRQTTRFVFIIPPLPVRVRAGPPCPARTYKRGAQRTKGFLCRNCAKPMAWLDCIRPLAYPTSEALGLLQIGQGAGSRGEWTRRSSHSP